MIDILIKNGIILTMDPDRRLIENGAVAIAGNKIVAVGESQALVEQYEAQRTIDANHMIVMPGIIDAHAHAGHGLIKTMGSDDAELWYHACEKIYTQGSTADFWYAESQLSALERLKTGTTFGVSYLGGGESFMATDHPRYGAAYCQAVEKVGIRSMLAAGVGGPPFPRRYIRWENGQARNDMVSHQQMLDSSETLIKTWHGAANGKLHVCLSFPTPKAGQFTPGTADFADLVRRAKSTHELGQQYGVLWTMDGHATGTIAFTHEHLGVLGPDAFLSHCIDITDDEIAICRDTDTKVVHNASAVYSIMGRCPVPELLDEGVTVMIGSDGTAPDRSYDMFRHMWQCMHYHRRHFRDPDILPPGKVLEMITIDAARGLGVEDELGSLEVGKTADIVLVDMDKPHLYPLLMPAHRLIYFAKGSDVDTVIVNGEILMEKRQVKTVNEADVLAMAQAEITKALDRTGLWSYLQTRDGFWGQSHY
ncbi:MAG: amidohydrolase family protein [Chloroflexota bacterium]